jgi:hypothetical protein
MSQNLFGNPAEPRVSKHSPRARLAFALAAIPAGFLPVSYLVMAGFVLMRVFPALMRGDRNQEVLDAPLVMWICQVGFYGTLIQWPFYLAWAACSRELTVRLRMLWMAHIFLLNMFAMPWFLYCKYRGTTGTALTQGLRHKRVKEWFERRGA